MINISIYFIILLTLTILTGLIIITKCHQNMSKLAIILISLLLLILSIPVIYAILFLIFIGFNSP